MPISSYSLFPPLPHWQPQSSFYLCGCFYSAQSHIMKIIQYMVIYDWLLSLGPCVLQHVAVLNFFLLLGNIPLHIHTQSSLSIHLSMDTCFRVLVIVNSITMNIGVHVSFQIIVFSRYMPRTGIAGSYGRDFFKEPPYCCP